jgi:hypothetical protein
MRAPLTQRKAASAAQARPSGEAQELRPIAPVSLAAGPTSPAIVPAELAGQTTPRIEWVAPRSLFVEEGYQRQLSRNSLTLIRKIVAGWNWAHVKPPIVARATIQENAAKGPHSPKQSSVERYFVIDGQHTAIAAVTHGGIDKLPVIVVEPGALDRRAAAFIAHNRDRLHLTPMQMHYAALAAGDESSRAINAACLLAGAHICRVQPAEWKPGDTVAVASIAALVKAAGVEGAAEVLKILVDAGRAPIVMNEIKAVATLLHDRARPCDAKALAAVVGSDKREVWARLALSIASERNVHVWRALADLWRSQLNGEAVPPRAAAPSKPAAIVDAPRGGAAIGGAVAKAPRRPVNTEPAAPPRVPRVEKEILDALANGPVGFDALVRRTAYPSNAVRKALAALLWAGQIARTGELYRRRA